MFFRAFYAIPPLTNEKGLPTNALYGFLNMTLKLLRDVKPDYLAFCFDRKERSFRFDLYDQYKAHRDEMPDDLALQVPYIRKMTDVLGIKAIDAEGFEADDVIGTLTSFGKEHELEVVIVSGDKDFAQLITQNVVMFDTMKDVRYTVSGVKDKWGIEPHQMIDYLSLVGDNSDNIPGVKGIGAKGAQKLLSEYESLDGIYKNLEAISGKSIKQKLIDGKEMAFLSQKLVTIHQTIPLKIELEEFKRRELDMTAVTELLLELGFKNILKNFQTTTNAPAAAPAPEAAKKIRKAKRGPLALISFAEFMNTVQAYSDVSLFESINGLHIAHKQVVAQVDISGPEFSKILGQKHYRYSGFDIKEMWKLLNLTDPLSQFDSMIAAYVIKAGATGDFQATYNSFMPTQLTDLLRPEEMYSAHLELEAVLKEQLKTRNGEGVFKKIEMPVVAALFAMEQKGILVDREFLGQQSQSLDKDLRALETKVFEYSDGPFNIGSPKQLGQILFDKLKLPVQKKTKTGYSTGSDVLEKLDHPIAKLIVEYRELAKLKSTYVDALPLLIHPETGRLHTTFRQAQTTTGRLSSVNPNLQNIPIRTERGRLVRKAFIADEGNQLIAADYSQIELRILAHMTDDPGLTRAFKEELDIHAATASEIFNVELKNVTSDMRRASKAVNFGIAYGQGAFGLSESLGIPRNEASDIIKRYFDRFKNVREYMDQTIRAAYENGYVETLFGRRRYLDELKSKSQAIKKFGERAAINAPMQGTASDLVKMAMVKIYQEVSVPILLQVHDELLFEAPDHLVQSEVEIIRNAMENVYRLNVPLRVNIACGINWEDAHS